MQPTTLPPLVPVSVSTETRLAYVLDHFRLAYPGAPAVLVGYANHQPQVEIAAGSGQFFAEAQPYPAAPNWRDWQGQRVPFLFDNSPEKPLLVLQDDKAFIGADIISAAFYLLSGWQEYFSTERDQHGRFPYAASVQKLYDFVTLPVVNYYFDILKTAIEHVSKQVLNPRRWGSQQADFAAFISHDIDNLRSAWKAPAKAALKQRKLSLFSKLAWQHFTQPDAWDNLEAVAAATAQYGAKSTFFILPTHKKSANGTPNADYRLTSKLKQRLWQLEKQGCELGLHNAIGTSTGQIGISSKEIPFNAAGCRFHYLSWEPRITPVIVTFSPIATDTFIYDSTLGFAEHFGFRHSFCLPFYPFNFSHAEAFGFLEIPLNVMDATLHHPNYLQLQPAEMLPALQPVFAEIKRFGGVASVLWHNENFDPANTRNGPQQFHEIMAHLQQQGAAFLTGSEVWQEFTGQTVSTTF
ncbi:hypothetical protein GCM10027422_02060 [Hymenobacter arcticus]